MLTQHPSNKVFYSMVGSYMKRKLIIFSVISEWNAVFNIKFLLLFINLPSTYQSTLQCLYPGAIYGAISIKIMNACKGKCIKQTLLLCVCLTAWSPHEHFSLAPQKWDNSVDLVENNKNGICLFALSHGFDCNHYKHYGFSGSQRRFLHTLHAVLILILVWHITVSNAALLCHLT